MTARPPVAELRARAAWSRLAEPGDAVARAVTTALGVGPALDWVRDVAATTPPDAAAVALPSGLALPPATAQRVARAALRWAPRVPVLDPDRDLDALDRLGGRLVTPGTPEWPAGLDDLGAAAPWCLWVLGDADLAGATARSVALVGARACTAYGEHVAAELASGLADDGVAVVSGGAYGVDAAAHRGALAAGGRTVALLAGGVDRAYPAGNARLLRSVVVEGGALVSEVPPGSVPSRSRFLERNRLIAAVARATVVVEAAWRSGALSTARHAGDLLRPLGAVPGPVTSAASAGCHRLLRQGSATCVTDAAECLELVGPVDGAADVADGPAAPYDGLTETQRRTYDALPVRMAASAESLARTAGLTVAEVRAALGALELLGRTERTGDGWRVAPKRT